MVVTISMDGPGPATLQVIPSWSPDGISLRLAGEMDIATAHHLVELTRSLSAREMRHVRLDVSALAFVDASGLAAIVQSRTLVLRHGGRLTLHGVRPLLRRLLAITGLSAGFDLEPSLANREDR